MKTTSKKIMQPTTIKSKDNGCGTASGNLVLSFCHLLRCCVWHEQKIVLIKKIKVWQRKLSFLRPLFIGITVYVEQYSMIEQLCACQADWMGKHFHNYEA